MIFRCLVWGYNSSPILQMLSVRSLNASCRIFSFINVFYSLILVLLLTSCSKTGDFSIFVFSSLFLNFDRHVSFNSSRLEEGDIIKLGYYNSKPLEWIVLQIDDKKMLVLSKYGLFGDDNDHRVFGDTLEKNTPGKIVVSENI